ncbi:MAG: SIR2 family protein [Candidatus Saccharimonadales bacterium]
MTSAVGPNGGPIVDDPRNELAIDALRRRLASNPNIYPFIGAGLSVPFGYPSWPELLRDGAGRIAMKQEVDDLIAQGDYEQAMSLISTELCDINYQDFLRKTFEPRVPGPETWSAPVRFLPALPPTPIVTTNIDSVIEQMFDEQAVPIETIVGARKDRIRVAVEERQRCLIKLHGDYRDSSDRILTLEDYSRHYGPSSQASRRSTPFQGLVQNLLAGNSFLFLGFGMEERTKKLLLSIAKSGGLHSHWIVLPRQAKMPSAVSELHEANVRTVWYDQDRPEDIGAFLHWYSYWGSQDASPTRRFYDELNKANLQAALDAASDARNMHLLDPALEWNIAILKERAAHLRLAQGDGSAALELLRERVEYKHADPTSAKLAIWAIQRVLGLKVSDDGASAFIREQVSLLAEALRSEPQEALEGLDFTLTGVPHQLDDVIRFLKTGIARAESPLAVDPLILQAQTRSQAIAAYAGKSTADGKGLIRWTKKKVYVVMAARQRSQYSDLRRRIALRALVDYKIVRPAVLDYRTTVNASG